MAVTDLDEGPPEKAISTFSLGLRVAVFPSAVLNFESRDMCRHDPHNGSLWLAITSAGDSLHLKQGVEESFRGCPGTNDEVSGCPGRLPEVFVVTRGDVASAAPFGISAVVSPLCVPAIGSGFAARGRISETVRFGKLDSEFGFRGSACSSTSA